MWSPPVYDGIVFALSPDLLFAIVVNTPHKVQREAPRVDDLGTAAHGDGVRAEMAFSSVQSDVSVSSGSSMKVTPLELNGLLLIELKVHRDQRGFFVERYQVENFWSHGVPTHFVQDNHSRSLPGVLRGLHYQRGPAQGKLVGVVRGQIWDVAVDLRCDSPTFGRSVGVELTGDNGRQLWIPPGFAHGFCVLGDDPADVVYKVDAPYHPAGEGGIHWADPDLDIAWPLETPIVSTRDQRLGSFRVFCERPVAWQLETHCGRNDLVIAR